MTTKVRIEWVTLAPATTGAGATSDQPGTEYGVQELTTTGATPVASSAAPYFGLLNGAHLTAGVARITVIEGAAIVAAGVSPVPTETNGYRVVIDQPEPLDIPVVSGWLVSIIEAADAPPVLGVVSDAEAEASLNAINTDTNNLVSGQTTANTALSAIQTALGVLATHGDEATTNSTLSAIEMTLSAQATHGDVTTTNTALAAIQSAVSLLATHTDATATNAALGTINTTLGTLATHGDLSSANTTLSAISTALGTLATHADETTANTALAAIQASVALGATHTDAAATNTALGTINTALGSLATHGDLSSANTTLSAISTALGTLATHADETTANTALAAIQASVALGATHSDASATNTALGTINTALGTLATHGDLSSANTTLSAINTALGSLATHSDETTANTVLAAIQTAVGLLATHADETTANSALAAIQASVAAIPAQGQALRAASMPVTLASDPDYRSGATTLTAVDAATTTVAGQNGVSLITGAPTASSSVTYALNGHSSLNLCVVSAGGTAYTGAVVMEVSCDGGVTYAPASGKVRGTGATTGTVSAPGVFQIDVTGMTHFRARATTLTTGQPKLAATASAAPGLTQVLNPVPLRGVDGLTSASATNPLPIQECGPSHAAAGVTVVSGALVSNTLTAAFSPKGGRTAYLELTGAGSATVTITYLCNDGATYAPNATAVSGAAPVILDQVAYGGSPIRIPFETDMGGASVKASPGVVTGTVNFAFVQ